MTKHTWIHVFDAALHELGPRYVFCSCLRSGDGGLNGFGFEFWHGFACNCCIHPVGYSRRENIGPLVHGLIGNADCTGGCGC